MQISIQTSSLAPTDHKHPPDLELCVGNDFGERLVYAIGSAPSWVPAWWTVLLVRASLVQHFLIVMFKQFCSTGAVPL
jgi:hypothetical protein